MWACGEDALLCSVSAAVLWGMLRFAPEKPQVLTPKPGRRGVDGIELRVTTDLRRSDRSVRRGIPVTTPQRTLLDLASEPPNVVSDRALEAAAAQAERDGRLGRVSQLRLAARAHDRTGSARLRAALRAGPRLWRSDEERMATIARVEAGLPEPVIAHRIRTAAGRLEVDLSFPPHRVILEVDGGQHLLPLNAARDADRDAALDALGRVTVRVMAHAVRADPFVAPRAVAPVLSARGWR